MDEKIRAILDGPEMPCDFWLYRFQEVAGVGSEVSRKAEELRPLVKHFEKQGIKFPSAMPAPDLEAVGRRSVRVQLGRVKQGVSVAWERGLLSADDKHLAKRLHALCGEIRAMCGQEDRPDGLNSITFLTGAPRD